MDYSLPVFLLSCLQFISSQVFLFTFRSLIHLELIFVCGSEVVIIYFYSYRKPLALGSFIEQFIPFSLIYNMLILSYTIDPHCLQILYLQIWLLAKVLNPKLILVAFSWVFAGVCGHAECI